MPLGLCLSRAAVTVAVATSHFTLSWMHSIEKIRWEEDWRVTPAGLVIDEARIRGSGAGMDPPDGAVLRDGVWHYRPTLPPQKSVTLATSGFTPDHTLCTQEDHASPRDRTQARSGSKARAGAQDVPEAICKPLGEWIPGHGPVTLAPCTASP